MVHATIVQQIYNREPNYLRQCHRIVHQTTDKRPNNDEQKKKSSTNISFLPTLVRGTIASPLDESLAPHLA